MSLVNNMLRGLDQRRKDSDGSGGSVKLMPARDYVDTGKKNPLPFVVVGLVLLVVALVYYWVQLSASSSEQLDIRVQPLSSNSASSPDQLIQELEDSIVQAEIAEIAANNPQEAPLPPAVAQTTVGNVEAVAPLIELVEPVEAADVPASIPETVSAPSQGNAETAAADPELVRGAQAGSVKEAPEYSNAQMDTITVQTALRQISDGETEAAYQTLEQYIVSNRYAHQSRETYAKLLMSRGRTADANALIDAGLDLAPNHSGFKKVKARLLMAGGKLSEAVSILISRAPSVGDDPEYHDLLASAQLSSRDFSGAMISYRGLVQLDETQGKWWYGFAAAHDQLGNIQPARQAYSQAMKYSNLSANLRRRSQERLGALIP